MKKKLCFLLALLVIGSGTNANYTTDYAAEVEPVAVEEAAKPAAATLSVDQSVFTFNNIPSKLNQKIYKADGMLYISADEILPVMGYSIGWDSALGAFTCAKDGTMSYVFPARNNIWVGPNEYVFSETPLTVAGKMYISEKMLTTITGINIVISGNYRSSDVINVRGKELYCISGNSQIPLSDKIYRYNGEVYLPLEDIIPTLGYSFGWDASINAISCIKDGVTSYVFPAYNNIWVGANEYKFSSKPVIISSKTYIPESMFTQLTGYEVAVSGEIEEYKNVTLVGKEMYCLYNGTYVPLSDKAYMHEGKAHLPINDILPYFGYTIGWDAELNAVSCTKDGVVSYVFPYLCNIWVGPVEHVFSTPPLIISGRTYISAEMFAALTGSRVTVEGELTQYKNRNSILLSKRNDAHRMPGNYVVSGRGVTVADGFGMELVTVTHQGAKSYASMVNTVAASLDPNINVYSILIPTACEFYAPAKMYTNQLYGFQIAYTNMSDRVTPINIYDTMSEHAGEKLYFKTDHHWTQRGAYYAYKEFMSYQGINVPDINTFENYPSNSHLGSFVSFAKGTAAGNVLAGTPELLERFMPKHGNSGTIYYDQSLTSPKGTVAAVNKRTNAYHNFIGGDNPITIFDTTAPSDKVLVIIKESFGNAFATWAINDYKKVCVIDPRKFNGFDGHYTPFNLNQFCRTVGATDVLFINYPGSASSPPIRASILKMK